MRQQHYEAAYEAYLAKQQGGRPLGEGVEFAGVPPVAATSGEGDSSATASTSGVAVTVQQQQQRRASRRSVRRPGMPPQVCWLRWCLFMPCTPGSRRMSCAPGGRLMPCTG
jgi:hypothetical protein